MGAGTSALKGEQISKQADTSKALADTILKIFFTRADFKDLLSLASLSSCSTYVFTTSEALQTLFTRLQVYPKLGKKGEILFAPVSRLSPGLIATKESDQEKRKQMEERNIICMDVAYFYVRIFQIYAALALTLLDADPLRKASGIRMYKAKESQRAIFTGGSISKKSKVYTQIEGTPFTPLIEMETLQKEFVLREGTPSYIQIQTNKGLFSIEWVPVLKDMSQPLTLNCYFGKTRPIPLTITMAPETNTNIIMSINGTPIMEFLKESTGPSAWLFKCVGSQYETDNINEFKNCIDSYFDKLPNVQAQLQGVRAPSTTTSISGVIRPGQTISVSPGASSFQSFDEIKKVFDKRFKGEDFPKAYCIARAMTLLNPIFDTELINKTQPFYSQICSQKYDFEITDSMPRADRTPGANVYLKSLVALYYDDFLVKGNTVTFTQTETGRSSLRDASKKLALLYNIKDNQETFIESSTRFRHFGICSASASRMIEIVKRDFAKKIQEEVIVPMIKFQEEHTKKVNDLLKKMFSVDSKGELRFQPVLRNGGKAAVTAFSREAAALLLNYYLKSEAYYIKGVLMFEDKANANSFKFI